MKCFSSSHVLMWELDHKEGRTLENWWFWTMVLEKTLESPLDCKEIKLGNHKGYQPWIFIGRTDAETEVPAFWSYDAKENSLEKSLMLGKIESRRRRGCQRMRWLDSITDEQELGQTLGNDEGQVGLACCSPWGHKESDTTGWLNKNNNNWPLCTKIIGFLESLKG